MKLYRSAPRGASKHQICREETWFPVSGGEAEADTIVVGRVVLDIFVRRSLMPTRRATSTISRSSSLLRPGGLVIAHNMNTRQADPDYVKAITENPDLETLILLKEGTGVGVTLKKR